MTERPAAGLRALAAALLLALAAGGTGAQSRPGDPMSDEDVVRLFVTGRSAEELIAEIERRAPGFDVSPEMLDELRTAGLPVPVIEAMVRRQREAEAAARPPEPTVEEVERPPALRIFLTEDRKAEDRPVLRLREAVGPELAEAWRLDDDPESRRFADVAIYLACRTPEHVPDHWRSQSPLGRDFVSMPRHRMLEFSAGARRVGEGKQARLELEVPASLEVLPDPGVPHDLLLGIAAQAGGRYRRVLDDAWPELVLEDADRELAATVEQGDGAQAFGWIVRFEGERQLSSRDMTLDTPRSSMVTP